MASAHRSPILPTFQQMLGVTPFDYTRTVRRWMRRAAIVFALLGVLVTVGLLRCGSIAAPDAPSPTGTLVTLAR